MPVFRWQNYSRYPAKVAQLANSQDSNQGSLVLWCERLNSIALSDGTASPAQAGVCPAPCCLGWGQGGEQKHIESILSRQLGLSTLKGGYCYGKSDKALERGMSPQGPQVSSESPPSFCFGGRPQTVPSWSRWDEGHLDPNTPQPGYSNTEDHWPWRKVPISQPRARSFHSGTPKESGSGWNSLVLGWWEIHISQAQLIPSFIQQTLTRMCALKEGKEGRESHSGLLCKTKCF